MEDYDIITRLGGGTFADVYQGLEKSTKTFVAIKTLKKKYTKWEDCLDLRECKSLQKLHQEHLSSQPGNNHIIKLKQIIFIKETGTLNLIFEYMDEDLYELMKNQSPRKMSENQIRSIVYQTLLGLQFMHKYGFFHRDMKPENLLRINETIKIADFGLAREIRSMPPYTEYVSTRYYRAPECILKSTNYNSPIDIWGLGCIMAEMYLHPQPLFFGNNEKEVLYKICSILGTPNHNTWNEGIQQAKMVNIKFPNFTGTDLKNIIPDASDDAIDLMKLMLQWDPNKRPTANNLLNHRFFTNYTISNIISNPDGVSQTNKTFKRKLSIRSGRKISNHGFIDYRKNSISRILEDNEGFDSLINKLKNEIKEEDAALEKEKEMLNDEIEKELDNENNDFNNLILDDKKESYGNKKNKNEFDYKKSDNQFKSIQSEGNINYNNNYNFYNNNKNNIGITLDFDTDFKLKPTTNNTRERSAKRFLENTQNEMNANFSNVPNRFNKNEFVSITSNNKNFSNQFMGNNDMLIGEMNFHRRDNNNKNNKSSNNEILFGIESRRGKHK